MSYRTVARSLVLLVAFGAHARSQTIGLTSDGSPPEYRTFPLSLSGKAVDQNGQPIAGATIFLVSTGSSPDKLLARTVTQEDGTYAFDSVPLPESFFSKERAVFRAGQFQVFGRADGYAIAWKGLRYLYVPPDPMSKERNQADAYRRNGFIAGERIEIELMFRNRSAIVGVVTDENGKAVSGASVWVAYCDWDLAVRNTSDKNSREFYGITQGNQAMPDLLCTTTDADGSFKITSLPNNVFWRIGVKREPGYHALVTGTTSEQKAPTQVRVVLPRSRDVRVTALGFDGVPVSGIRVTGRKEEAFSGSSTATTDVDGLAKLRLPPGRYNLNAYPPRGVPCIWTTASLAVNESPETQEVTISMNAGAVLILRAVDVDDKSGIPGVQFWSEIDRLDGGRPSRTSVQSTTSGADNPKTDVSGKITAVVVPGKRRYGVGWGQLPYGYDFVDSRDESSGRLLELLPGQTITEVFEIRKIRGPENHPH